MVAITSIAEAASTTASHALGVVGGVARRMPLSTMGAAIQWLQTGTGAVRRSVEAKLQEWVSYLDYYETADGTNYQPALLRAVTANDYVYMPVGTRTFSTSTELGATKRIRGPGSQFADSSGGARCTANAGMFKNTSGSRRRWEIYGISIYGNNSVGVAAIDGPFGGLIHEVKIDNFETGIKNPEAFLSDYDRCCFTGSGLRAISLATTHGCSITRCHFDAGWTTHITNQFETPINSGVNNGGALYIFRGNHNASSNVNTNNSLIHVSGNCVIEQNYFEDFSPTGVPSGTKFIHIVVNVSGDFGLRICNNECNGSGEATNAVFIEGTGSGSTATNDCGGIVGYNRFLGFDNSTRPAVAFGTNNSIHFLRIEGNLPKTHSISNRNAFSIFKPMARGTWSNSVSIAGTTWVTLNIDGVETIDTSSGMTSVADTFRCRRDGYYRFTCHATMQATTNHGDIELRILKNGVEVEHVSDSLIVTSSGVLTNRNMTIDLIELCALNDDITVQARQGTNCVSGIFTAEWLSADGHSS